LRNDLYLTMEWPSDLEKVDKLIYVGNDVTRFAGWKFLIDGQGPTAYCHEAHTGKDWRTTTWDIQMYKDAVKALHNTGLQICTHTIGDAATDLVLDAYEAAMNANPRADSRHRIEHAILSSASAPKRMKELGVALSTQPGFLYLFGDGWQRLFGDRRMERIMITREWLNAGVHMAISSDAPSTLFYHPAATLAGAMNRVTLQDKVIGASQALSLKEALIAHTREAAYIGHQEKVKGSLEPGKYADIVVWPEDPTAITGQKLMAATSMYMTIVGGRIVHQG
jgi:hypothetical protein